MISLPKRHLKCSSEEFSAEIDVQNFAKHVCRQLMPPQREREIKDRGRGQSWRNRYREREREGRTDGQTDRTDRHRN